jgi:putative N-acetylmannosamine-6-phosphate epimerase
MKMQKMRKDLGNAVKRMENLACASARPGAKGMRADIKEAVESLVEVRPLIICGPMIKPVLALPAKHPSLGCNGRGKGP